ncbi:MAG TPA: DnaA regulatory inactivator Hda [Hyphomicrobiales bacterium]|nr:DnaA regulatory inactivator Hda [Hyphomicrobiales bacterium]
MGGFQYPFSFSFREDYDFASFLPGDANQPALAYLRGFAANTDPFCLVWGAEGSGKTHLLQALCRAAPQGLYLPLRQLREYGAEVLDGLAGQPLLVMDDLDAVAGEPAWEERLFQLCNAALAQATKLCVSSSLPLLGMPLALADLRSRLQLAVAFELHQPDDATRAALLRQLALRRGMQLRDDVVDYLLNRHQRDPAALLAVLERLDASSLAGQRRLTIPFIKQTLGW